jgi:hypothetical protein
VEKKKMGIIFSVVGSGLNPEYVLPICDLWSSEVKLHALKGVAYGALAGEPSDY